MTTSAYTEITPTFEREQGCQFSRSYPLRVAYDAQAFLSPNGGTGKGVQLRNLLGAYCDIFVGFATPGRNYSERSLIQRGLSRYQLWQQISLPFLLKKWRPDFFLAPYNTAPLFIPKTTKLILVLHDLILLEQNGASGLRERLRHELRRSLVPKAVSRAHTVLTVSSYIRRQIAERFPDARVQVIPCSIAPSWFDAKLRRNLSERENYILAVTSSAPHKNAHRALEAYSALVAMSERASVPRLRLVGLSDSAERFRALSHGLQVDDLVDIEPYLSERQLQDLYRRSRAVLVPSLKEGFGIPVLEGMASGTPVIAANAASLPEVGGAAATYFDPTDVGAITAAMKEVLDDRRRQASMVDLGFLQARQFHPDTVGRKVQAFWDSLTAQAA